MELTYTIRIEAFEGPFDLLLFFIERDELDIYDIPIAKIADDFLGYVHTMENLNIDMASEFILVAATLMRIKAKMLIPARRLMSKAMKSIRAKNSSSASSSTSPTRKLPKSSVARRNPAHVLPER